MLTPQEVSSHAFPKAVMGGYSMSAVDEFLDELTEDYSALYKENTALKAKLKVLVEKVEEYRATEDSMRATLLTAQKMADNIVREAETKRDVIVARAELDAQDRVTQLKEEAAVLEMRLQQGQQDLAAFITAVRGICQHELENLDRLPTLCVEEKPAEETPASEAPTDEDVASIVMAALETVTAEEPAEEEEEPAAEAEDEEEEDTKAYPEGNPFAPEGDLKSTRRIDLSELKFGRNYGKD